MPKGIALTIGLNSVDPKHYGGWSGPLQACEYDAEDMTSIAESRGFTTSQLLTASATRDAVLEGIQKAAKTLKAGDIFLVSYSGHGGQVPDLNDDETDNDDETWCLYDGELIDDELYAAWAKFAKGTRILVFSDSCHSGTVTKEAMLVETPGVIHPGAATATRGAGRGAPAEVVTSPYRAMPNDVAGRTYRANREFYDGLQKKVRGAKDKEIGATVLLISGCQDNQLSSDGAFNGLFTGTMLRVWKNGAFKGSYRRFHRRIVNRMPPDQTPNYRVEGTPSTAFVRQTPFTV